MKEKALIELANYCETCQEHECCPEEECILFRIEKLLFSEEEDQNI